MLKIIKSELDDVFIVSTVYKRSEDTKISFTYNKKINIGSGEFFIINKKENNEEEICFALDELIFAEANNKHNGLRGAREVDGIMYGYYLYQSKKSFRFTLDFLENMTKEEGNGREE